MQSHLRLKLDTVDTDVDLGKLCMSDRNLKAWVQTSRSYTYMKKLPRSQAHTAGTCRSLHDMPMQAHRRGGGMAPTYSRPQRYMRVGGQLHAPHFYPRKRPGTNCTGGWPGLRAGLHGMENLSPTVIQSPVHPAHSMPL
jgi:hypothetical protein